MTTSGRRPVNKPAATSGKSAAAKGAASSGRKASPPASAPRPRGRPGDDEVEQPSGAKQFMFFGTIALIVIVIILVVVKWEPLTTEAPKAVPPKVIKDQTIFDDVNALREKASKQFAEAIKIKSGNEARNKAISVALDTLTLAQDKLQALSEEPRYKDKEEYDQNFEQIQSKITIDMKMWRDAKRMGD